MSKIDQIKIPVDIQTNNWKLVRERDGLTKQSVGKHLKKLTF